MNHGRTKRKTLHSYTHNLFRKKFSLWLPAHFSFLESVYADINPKINPLHKRGNRPICFTYLLPPTSTEFKKEIFYWLYQELYRAFVCIKNCNFAQERYSGNAKLCSAVAVVEVPFLLSPLLFMHFIIYHWTCTYCVIYRFVNGQLWMWCHPSKFLYTFWYHR